MGTRLGRQLPKPLTELADGRTILAQQLANIDEVFGWTANVTIVVGHKADFIIDASPKQQHVWNGNYAETNTSKSLLLALQNVAVGGVLWLNGDVVFDPDVLRRAVPIIAAQHSFIAVDVSQCGDEEVKYTVDGHGFIDKLSKTVRHGLGEAVGVNYVTGADRRSLIKHLAKVNDQDYFEAAVERSISRDDIRYTPLDISDLYAVEVDMESDLVRANFAALPRM